MADQTYGRGQVEWALWDAFTGQILTAPRNMPKVFATRIKNLLDLDRRIDLSAMEEPPECDFAFAPLPVDGAEISYKPVDAFCLAIALDLLDTGCKQSEVVFLMKYLRKGLEGRFRNIGDEPSLIDRQRHLARNYPDFPFTYYKGTKIADARVFMIIQKFELTEINPSSSRGRPNHPTFLAPVYCHGTAELADKIDGLMPTRRRASTIVEIARTAQAVRAFLSTAPLIKRGRPRNS